MFTLDELRTDELKLRQAAGEVLNPGPWKHREGVTDIAALERDEWICCKCLQPRPQWSKDCPIPDPVVGPLEVIAEKLKEKVSVPDLLRAIMQYRVLPREEDTAYYFGWALCVATPAERIICCLLALGKVKI